MILDTGNLGVNLSGNWFESILYALKLLNE